MKKLFFGLIIGGIIGYLLGTGNGIRLGSEYSLKALAGEDPSTWLTKLGVDKILKDQVADLQKKGSDHARQRAADYLKGRIDTVLTPSDDTQSGPSSTSDSQ